MSKYKEIFKLNEMLTEAKIEHQFIDRGHSEIMPEFESYQILCPNDKDRYISVIEGLGTYGNKEDKLEIMRTIN